MEKLPTRYEHRLRAGRPACFVLHSTGSTDEKAVAKYYQTSSSGVAPHRLILRSGEVLQFVDLDRVAHHTGLSAEQERAYRKGRPIWPLYVKDGPDDDAKLDRLPAPFAGYDEWLERWPNCGSPLDLPSGDAPNGNSIGIELAASAGRCTEEQYAALVGELRGLSASEGVELSRRTVLGHGDANPIARCSKKGLTDPGPHFDWARVYWELGI